MADQRAATVVTRYGGKERTTCCDVAPEPGRDGEAFRRCSRCHLPLHEEHVCTAPGWEPCRNEGHAAWLLAQPITEQADV